MMSSGLKRTLNSALVCLLLISLLLDCVLAAHMVSAEKRTPRRYPRARYRVGYLFGKRSSESSVSSLSLFDILSSNAVTTSTMQEMLQKQPSLLKEIVTIMDKNNDGYITLSDLL